MKRILFAAAAAVMLLSGCSDVKSRSQGIWRLNRVDGLSLSDYSEQSGIDISGLDITWSVNGSEVSADIGGVPLFTGEEITYTDSGFRFASDTATGGAPVTVSGDTLSYFADVNGRKTEHLFIKEE